MGLALAVAASTARATADIPAMRSLCLIMLDSPVITGSGPGWIRPGCVPACAGTGHDSSASVAAVHGVSDCAHAWPQASANRGWKLEQASCHGCVTYVGV